MSYFNVIFLIFFFVSIVLFLRFLVLFLFLLLNRIDKKKVIMGGLFGVTSVLVVIITAGIIQNYITHSLPKKFEEINKNNTNNIQVIIEGVSCSADAKMFIKELSQMRERHDYDQGRDKKINIKLVVNNNEEINLSFKKKREAERDYLLYFNDLAATSNKNIGVITTTYISECLKEKPEKNGIESDKK